MLDLAETKAQMTQEEVAAAEHVTVSGEIAGSCEGRIRLDVIEGNPGGGQSEGPKGPLTVLDVAAVGAYSIKVPTGRDLMINALCDVDKDDKIVVGTDKLARAEILGQLTEDKDGVALDLDAEPGAPGGQGGQGGPPPEGGQGGPPPAGKAGKAGPGEGAPAAQ